jgi:FdhD protein
MARRVESVPVFHVDGDKLSQRVEPLCVESPLQIWIKHGPHSDAQPLTITMRTPSERQSQRDEEDADLALGFLYGEGLIHSPSQVIQVDSPLSDGNSVVVTLSEDVPLVGERLSRSFFSTSACGVCGKSTVEGLSATPREPVRAGWPTVNVEELTKLPSLLRAKQATFDKTGGLHAAALFDETLSLVALREDVGRHNAVDKLIGSMLRKGALPLHGHLLLVSGRASFELVQKARMAAIPLFVAIGAPSSLALEVARSAGITLVGFLREARMNVYCGFERLQTEHGPLYCDDDVDAEKDDSVCQTPSIVPVGRRLPTIPDK